MKLRGFQGFKPSLGKGVYVDPAAVVVGRVSLDDDVSLWPCVVARGDVNEITISARSNIQDGSVLHVTHDGPFSPGGFPLRIGQDVTVAHNVTLHGCTIGDRCMIGMGSCVMDGAVLEDAVLLAAGSLVPPGKSLQAGGLYRGRPAQRVRELRDEELEYTRYAAAHYVRLKDRYLGAL